MIPQATTTRRELCRDGLRWLALGGLTVLSAGLLTKRGDAAGCRLAINCRDCHEIGRCELRPAQQARQEGERR